MRTTFLAVLLGLCLTGWSQKAPEKVEGGYKIEIKTSAVCGMCKTAIEKDLTFEKGVKEVTLDVDTKIATIIYNDKKTSPEALRERIAKVGYNADDKKRDAEAYKNLPMCCKEDAKPMDHKKGHH